MQDDDKEDKVFTLRQKVYDLKVGLNEGRFSGCSQVKDAVAKVLKSHSQNEGKRQAGRQVAGIFG